MVGYFDWLTFVGSRVGSVLPHQINLNIALAITLAMHPPIVNIYDFYLYSFIDLMKRFKMVLLSSIYLKAK